MSRFTLFGIVGVSAVLGGVVVLGVQRFALSDAPTVFPSEFGVGEALSDIEIRDLDGSEESLFERMGSEGILVVMRDSGCPVCQKYGHRLAELEDRYAARGLPFLFLNVSPQDSEEDIRSKELGTYGFDGSYVWDPDGAFARALNPRLTTEVFLIDRAGTLVYRGAVDDQFGISFALPEVRNAYLIDAVESLLAGEAIDTPYTEASGCYLATDHWANHSGVSPTYHNRVSRIVQDNCVECHRVGGVAPFSLEHFSDVHGFRAMIDFVVRENRMPPWFAAPGDHEWANDRTLPAADRADLLAWIAAGAPEGDPSDAPEPRAFPDGWKIGTPDAIVELEEAVPVPASGVVDYRYMYVKTDFPEDRWIQRMEVRPTAQQVTHHVLVFLEEPDAERPDGGIAGFFAGTVPGHGGNIYPDGSAKLLPKGAWLKFQLHYTPNGTATEDRTQIGFIFADGPPEHVVRTGSAFNRRFVIPPGAPDHEVTGRHTFRRDARILTFFPHMHVRGKRFLYELIRDGESETVLEVPRYDFNWQLAYQLKEPILVRAGTILRATGWFDNSEGNPANPDPTAEVRFGEQTWDEMMIGYFDWIDASSGPPTPSDGGG